MGYGDRYKMAVDIDDYFHIHYGCRVVTGNNGEFLMHYHPYYEIYVYISGKSEFFIEDTIFRLKPYDIIIVPPYTMHQPQPYVGETFDRLVINVYPNFFKYMDCPEYASVFSNLQPPHETPCNPL